MVFYPFSIDCIATNQHKTTNRRSGRKKKIFSMILCDYFPWVKRSGRLEDSILFYLTGHISPDGFFSPDHLITEKKLT